MRILENSLTPKENSKNKISPGKILNVSFTPSNKRAALKIKHKIIRNQKSTKPWESLATVDEVEENSASFEELKNRQRLEELRASKEEFTKLKEEFIN